MAMQELDASEKQWLEVCGQIDKLDKFFPLSAVAISKAREAQAAAIARGATFCLSFSHGLQCTTDYVGQQCLPCSCLTVAVQAGRTIITQYNYLQPVLCLCIRTSALTPLQVRQGCIDHGSLEVLLSLLVSTCLENALC